MAEHEEYEQDEEYLHIAANALKAIENGTAATWGPFKYALYGRVMVEKCFEILARVYTVTPSVSVLLLGATIVIFGIFCAGFVYADVNSTFDELAIRISDQDDVDYTRRFVGDLGTQEVVVQYRPQPNLNNTNFTNTLLDHVRLMRSIIDLPVNYNDR